VQAHTCLVVGRGHCMGDRLHGTTVAGCQGCTGEPGGVVLRDPGDGLLECLYLIGNTVVAGVLGGICCGTLQQIGAVLWEQTRQMFHTWLSVYDGTLPNAHFRAAMYPIRWQVTLLLTAGLDLWCGQDRMVCSVRSAQMPLSHTCTA
jgi:hypothetical protein